MSLNTIISSSVFTWGLNGSFFVIILAVGVMAKRRIDSQREPHFVDYAPSLATSLGLFGTFLGVFLGLWSFNPQDVDNSIAGLLEGLKTAFITSLMGMAAAILIKWYQNRDADGRAQESSDSAPDRVGPMEIHAALTAQLRELEKLAARPPEDRQAALLEQIQQWREESSLRAAEQARHREADGSQWTMLRTTLERIEHRATTVAASVEQRHVERSDQLKALVQQVEQASDTRAETHLAAMRGYEAARAEQAAAFQQALWDRLQAFAEMMSRAASDQMINALREVIETFNKELNEKVGNNFQHLQQAVLQLVQWQENYRQQLSEMHAAFDAGAQSLNVIESQVASLQDNARQIPPHLQALAGVIETNQHQVEELQRHLQAFADVRDRAVTLLPTVQEKLDEVGQRLQEGSDRMNQALLDSVELLTTRTNAANESLARTGETLSTRSTEIAQGLTSTASQVQSGLEGLERELTASIERTLTRMSTELGATSTSLSNAVKEVIDQAAQQSLRVQTDFSKQLESSQEGMNRHTERVLSQAQTLIQQAVTQTEEKVNAQLRMLDEALEKQLNAALRDLGSSLGAIARHIGDAYQSSSKASLN